MAGLRFISRRNPSPRKAQLSLFEREQTLHFKTHSETRHCRKLSSRQKETAPSFACFARRVRTLSQRINMGSRRFLYPALLQTMTSASSSPTLGSPKMGDNISLQQGRIRGRES